MPEDIRDKPFISHQDVVDLNFIRPCGPYHFRRHYRQGLRSHVMEVIRTADIEIETHGTPVDGVRQFPRAVPVRILRLFRTKLTTVSSALTEIQRVKLVERYLAPEFLARSNEFIVEYTAPGGAQILLCGLQEYVDGEILDPWGLLDGGALLSDVCDRLHGRRAGQGIDRKRWVAHARQNGMRFVRRVKRMIAETGHIPDLAGAGNMMVLPTGTIKLVDINNIARVSFERGIPLDDKGYPVCDKSVEALFRLEEKLTGTQIDRTEPLYAFFLDPARMKAVKVKEDSFYSDIKIRSGFGRKALGAL